MSTIPLNDDFYGSDTPQRQIIIVSWGAGSCHVRLTSLATARPDLVPQCLPEAVKGGHVLQGFGVHSENLRGESVLWADALADEV